MIYNNNHYETLLLNGSPYYEYDRNVELVDIKRFMKDYHSRQREQVCIHELRIDSHRFDFVSLNPFARHIKILEYKVMREDFNGDNKHLLYMGYCNTLAFVTPLGLVEIDDLKDRAVGLMQVFRWARRERKQERWTLGAIWVKRPRGRKLDVETYYRIMGMMLLRLVQGRKGDFF